MLPACLGKEEQAPLFSALI